jgi:hypothetical protein
MQLLGPALVCMPYWERRVPRAGKREQYLRIKLRGQGFCYKRQRVRSNKEEHTTEGKKEAEKRHVSSRLRRTVVRSSKPARARTVMPKLIYRYGIPLLKVPPPPPLSLSLARSLSVYL